MLRSVVHALKSLALLALVLHASLYIILNLHHHQHQQHQQHQWQRLYQHSAANVSTPTPTTQFNAKLRVLLLVESVRSHTQPSALMRELLQLFDACRFDYKMQHVVSPSPRRSLLVLVKRSYSTLVVVESSRLLDAMRRDERDQLFDWARQQRVGLVVFHDNLDNGEESIDVDECRLSASSSSVFALTKPLDENVLSEGRLRRASRFLPFTNYDSSVFEALLSCTDRRHNHADTILASRPEQPLRLVLVGVENVFEATRVGAALMLDMLAYASHERYRAPLTRLVQIDIDDVFVGASGTRLRAGDVSALVAFQRDYLNKRVFNSTSFRFNLGFSGHYYRSGSEEENKGDEKLIGK